MFKKSVNILYVLLFTCTLFSFNTESITENVQSCKKKNTIRNGESSSNTVSILTKLQLCTILGAVKIKIFLLSVRYLKFTVYSLFKQSQIQLQTYFTDNRLNSVYDLKVHCGLHLWCIYFNVRIKWHSSSISPASQKTHFILTSHFLD